MPPSSSLCGLLLAVVTGAGSASVIVEELPPSSPLRAAGITAGDTLVGWRQDDRRGPLSSPFDWWWLEAEVKPRGPLALHVIRGSDEKRLTVSGGEWRTVVRPPLPPSALALYRSARAAAERGEPTAGELFERLWAALSAGTVERRWALVVGGRAAAGAGLFAAARAALDEAERGAVDPIERRAILRARASAAGAAGDRAEAQALWRRVTELEEATWGEGPALAESLGDWSGLYVAVDDPMAAQALVERAARLQRRAAPGSLALALSLDRLAQLADLRGDEAAAEGFLDEAYAITAALPAPAMEARVWQSRAMLAYGRGDRDGARGHLRRALAIHEADDPEGSGLTSCLNNLGVLAEQQGRFAEAIEHYRRALAVIRRQRPGSLSEADLKINLGVLARRRGELRDAESLLEEALAIQRRRVAPGSAIAATLTNLGNIAHQRGQLRLAEHRYTAALETLEALPFAERESAIVRYDLGILALARGDPQAARRALTASAETLRRVPDALALAKVLGGLGLAARQLGDAEAEASAFREALETVSSLAPGGPEHAIALADLAQLDLRRQRLGAAAAGFRSALGLWEAMGLEAFEAAICHHGLARIARQQGRLEEARRSLELAVRLLDRETARLAVAPDLRARFRAEHRQLHVDYVHLLVEVGELSAAFEALEAYRGRGFLERVAARDLDFSTDLPPGLESRRRDLISELAALQEAGPGETAERARAEAVRHELHRLSEEVRHQAPTLAALRHPEPLGLAAVQEAIDDGSALLSYLVAPDETVVFIVDSEGPVRAETLPLSEAALERSIRRFRRLVVETRPGVYGERRLPVLLAAAAELYRDLIAPVEAELAGAERWLVLPDGPLHELPFPALVDGRGRFLIEERPLHVALSATVWAHLADARAPPSEARSLRLVAFGDPETNGVADVRSAGREALPASRIEVEAVARLYGQASEVFLAERATRANAVAAAPHADVLHFATHARLDPEEPLASALLFSPAGGAHSPELRVWEIFERLRIEADVVVLSACDSALGARLGGDGILGLTRAFQVAGARSVISSLWPVSDRRTADLMVRFHRQLTAGRPVAEALQHAQRELLAETPYPYFWAAFQVYGDWR